MQLAGVRQITASLRAYHAISFAFGTLYSSNELSASRADTVLQAFLASHTHRSNVTLQ